ncbi:Alpha/Beta hydrolase protein [Cladochytrium replicatum]|nr:Alpha/Beta hydrolase protein [Cladochytrium replicatum]
MKHNIAVVLLAICVAQALGAAVEPRQACSALWGQCGGQGWSGPTCCASGSTCTFSNPYYSQCLPGSVPPATTTSRANPSTTTTRTSGPSPTTTSAPSTPGRSAGCGKTPTLRSGTININGRQYILNIPSNYDNNKPYRFIVALHWLNGNMNAVANSAYYGLQSLSSGSTIFVAPNGINAGWGNSGGSDITFIDSVMAQVQNDLCIDTTRVFATGFSYGAAMSYALACARGNVFRGVVTYAGANLSGCNGGNTPVAYFGIHGVADSVLNISNGRQLRDNFVRVNQCTNQSPPEPARASGSHICTSYSGCMSGKPVRWCAHSGDHVFDHKDNGAATSWIPGEAWKFISQF